MDTEKQIKKLQSSLDKLHGDKAAFIKNLREERKKQTAKTLSDAGIDTDGASDELSFEEMQKIEMMFNTPIGRIYEELRQIEFKQKRVRVESIPALIEKIDPEIERLENELKAKRAERVRLDIELRQLQSDLEYKTKPGREVYYQNQVPTIMGNGHIFAKKQALEYLINY